MVLKTARITKQINSLPINSAAEKQIMALVVSFGDGGLTASNNALAEFLCIERRSVYRIINRLRNKGLVVDKGKDKSHRKLVANIPAQVETARSLSEGNQVETDGRPSRDRAVYKVETALSPKYNKGSKGKTNNTNDPIFPLDDGDVNNLQNSLPQSQSEPQELPEIFTDYQENYPEDPHRFVSAEQQAFNERCNAAIRTETENVS